MLLSHEFQIAPTIGEEMKNICVIDKKARLKYFENCELRIYDSNTRVYMKEYSKAYMISLTPIFRLKYLNIK